MFCDFELHDQAPDHPLQLGDAFLILAPLTFALEEALKTLDGDLLPTGNQLRFPLVLPGDLGRRLEAGEDLEDNLGLKTAA